MFGQRRVGRIVADQGDVGPVQGGDHARGRALGVGLCGAAREEGTHRVGYRIVGMQHVQTLPAVQVQDARGDREVVGRRGEQRVRDALGDVHLDRPGRVDQPRRDVVGEQVHAVPVRGQAQGQLAGDDARPPVGGVADDPDGERHALRLITRIDGC